MDQIRNMRSLYAYAHALGISDGTREDALHQMIGERYGAESVKELTDAQTAELIGMLRDWSRSMDNAPAVTAMSHEQQQKVWRLMYQLQSLDKTPSAVAIGDRLCGIIRRELHEIAHPRDPFRHLDAAQGSRLIECIKQYIRNAKRRDDHGQSG